MDAITTLPPGAHWLMSSTDCPYQAFRVGTSAWGVQFHPEITPARLRDWDPARLHRLGFAPDEVSRTAQRNESAADPVWRTVAHRFAAVVRAGGAPSGTGRPENAAG
ncbi:hypothetical protein [Streptomyces oceani]|uniref:hypothetical protein n=1 Tax=Streptomyces oceani TaxID=1075402 RepID=UPI000AEBC241